MPSQISIHALLAESDEHAYQLVLWVLRFLSTLSLRRATVYALKLANAMLFLSTLSLRRATVHYDNYNLHCVISIHALLAESDFYYFTLPVSRCLFLSTLSLRRATVNGDVRSSCFGNFYPRSPCGERHILDKRLNALAHFYPRSPCGERRGEAMIYKMEDLFLSTLSLRRATPPPCQARQRAGNFYPRSPCGERRHDAGLGAVRAVISIHALLAESDYRK